ncbi:MAG: TonB-dependent receptor [Sphingobacteriaceae bacterium]|nr:MAG: TonB-dependent receptor [Sphingobacteriaceae bacterium]
MTDFTLIKKLKTIVVCVFLLFIAFKSSAQTGTVTGKITDSKSNETLIGATVQVKGSTTGTATDLDGNFTLKASEGNVLEIKSIGYTTLTVAADFSKPMLIRLTPANTALNEVLVVGYATQRKADLTGAVSSIKSSDIANLPVGGADQILQGKAAGVAVTQSTGAPGDGINVRIRGIGTINNNNPLYVIDGVPTPNGINQIAPNDIESISVLKDASSAAIYGARAANGVVIVTTKRGKNGPPKVNVNAYTGIQISQHLIKMANTAQYINAYNTAAVNDGRAQIPASVVNSGLADVNWQKEVLKPAPINNAQIAISGGSDNSTYIVSANYFGQEGLIKNSSFDRLNLRTSINSTLSKIFTAGTNLNLSYSKNRQVGTSGDGFGDGNPGASVTRYALFRTPATPVFNANGQYVDIPANSEFFGDGLNPVGFADNYDRNFNNYSLLGNVFLEINPIKNLKIRSDFGTNFIISDYKQFFATWGIDRFLNSPNSLAQSNNKQFDFNWTNTATYNLTLAKKHVFNFLAGTEIIKSNTQALSASRNTFADQNPVLQYLNNGLMSQLNGSGESNWALFSIFGRINYAFNNKYLATVNFRRDGSSRLDPSNRYGNFYGGSLGWRIDQEEFLKNIKPVSLLKLRAGIGQLGNQEIGNQSYVTQVSNTGYYPFNNTSNPGNSVTYLGNPSVRWETSTQTDVGLDIGLFDGALSISTDYYIKNTSGMLLQPRPPSSVGAVASGYVNAGKMRNQGFEFEVNYRNAINQKFKYELIGNFSPIKNEVTSLANGAPLVGGRIDNNYFATQTAVGHPVGSFYLLQQEGIFQNAQQVFTHAYQGPGIRPGDVMFKDISGPNGVPDGIIDNNDRSYVGSPIPKFTYGLTTNFSYSGFDMSLFFQGVQGNKLYNQINTDIEGFYRSFNVTERIATQSWTGEGSTNEFPRLSWTGANNNKQPSTRFLEDGSYLRLKNIQLGYTIGSQTLKALKLSSVRVFASAQNVFTVTKYTGIDPEIYTNSNSSGDGVRAVGIDWGTYPSARTFTIGLNANF